MNVKFHMSSHFTADDEGDVCEQLERLKTQIAELQRKETYHVMRLTAKEQEIQDMAVSVN